MAGISNIGSTPTSAPTDANRPSATQSGRHTTHTAAIDPAGKPKFVDRRKNPDRRVTSKKPLLDTRRNTDRRRTGRFEVKI